MKLPGYVPVGQVVWSGAMERRGEAPTLTDGPERREPLRGAILARSDYR